MDRLSYKLYRKTWNKAYQITPDIPLNVDLELSAICNLRCPFCPVSKNKLKSNKFMTYDDIFNSFEGWFAYAKLADTYYLRKKLFIILQNQYPREIATKEINRLINAKENYQLIS